MIVDIYRRKIIAAETFHKWIRRTRSRTVATGCLKRNEFASSEAIDLKGVRVIVNPGGTNQDYVDKYIRYAQIVRAPDNAASL